MESIRKYIKNFFKNHKINTRYDIGACEMISAIEEARGEAPVEAIADVFKFGYAKGYRAAAAEMRKKSPACAQGNILTQNASTKKINHKQYST